MSAEQPSPHRDLGAVFEQRFDHAPAGVWAAPGRVNLIGEHTDYNDGLVLPIALEHCTRVAAATRDDGRLRLVSRQASEVYDGALADLAPEAVTGWARYAAGAVWALREDGVEVPGLDLLVDSDVPIGAGLSSSAALECAVALAVSELLEGADARPREDLVRVATRAENDFAGVPSGSLDQSASMLCTAGHALFLDVRSGEREQVPFDLAADGLVLLVIDTSAPHDIGDGQYAVRRRSCEEAARALGVSSLREVEDVAALAELPDELMRRARHVVTENARVAETVALLRAGDLPRVGPVLTASHASMRDDYEISVEQVDVCVDVCLQAGALGARMTGGGFGGSVIALVTQDRAEACVKAVTNAYVLHGFAAPQSFAVAAGAGARRLH